MTTTRLPVHAVPCHTRHTALHPRRMAQCHRNTHRGMYCGEHKAELWHLGVHRHQIITRHSSSFSTSHPRPSTGVHFSAGGFST